jgi:hypothetical protein
VVTGLAVEETPSRLVLKTAEGERVAIDPSSIEERSTSDVSLMPDGLAQTMTGDELVDLLAYLGTLRQPVSIVGQYSVVGPLSEPPAKPMIDAGAPLDLGAPLDDGLGHKIAWRRATANAEGLVDLSAHVGRDPNRAAYAVVVVDSPVRQQARLVLDTPSDVRAWLGGKPVPLSDRLPGELEPRFAQVDLRQGASTLLIRIAGGDRPHAESALATTFVTDRPVGFRVTLAKHERTTHR